MRGLFAIAIAVLVCSCDRREPYACASSDQCVSGGAQGVCEPTGFCSFGDPSCEGGRRYEPNAGGGVGGACVEVDAGIPPTEVCGAVSQACCQTGPACIPNGRCSGGTCARCVSDVALGRHAACVLKHDGTVWCAGENEFGQLGFGIAGEPVPTWTQARDATSAPITDATAVTGGWGHACAVRAGGTVWCWGNGFGTSAVRVVKTDDTPLTGIVEVGAGYGHRCGRDEAGGVWCWGGNTAGQLGDGTLTTRAKAAAVLDAPNGPPLTGALSLTVGGHHACVRKTGDDVWCWGRNTVGQLGDTTQTNRPSPVKVASARSIAAGLSHTCAVRSDGTVWCSGDRWRSRLGDGIGYDNDDPGPSSFSTPVQVVTTRGGPPFTNATQVAAGGVSCAIAGGSVHCWGTNLYGQTGSGAGTTTPAPVLTTDGKPLSGIERIVAFGPQACAFRDDGEILCWGRGLDGQFGDGTFGNRGLARPLGLSCQ